MTIKIIIADDHKIMREGLRSLIEKEIGMTVVGDTDTGRKAVSMATKSSPNVVVMDVAMPDLNGIEATRMILAANPAIRIVALSGHTEQKFVSEMLRSGASAYLLKHRACEELIQAIREAMLGRTYLSPEVARGLVDTYVRGSAPTSQTEPAFTILTPREREILQQVAEGKSAKGIAFDLHVSEKTVLTHRRNIMQKLHLNSIAELTKYAIQEGVTSLDVRGQVP